MLYKKVEKTSVEKCPETKSDVGLCEEVQQYEPHHSRICPHIMPPTSTYFRGRPMDLLAEI
jgi:hypothetical protein